MIVFKDWEITADGLLGHQFDNLSRSIDVVGDLPEGWSWTMLVQVGKHLDIIGLEYSEDGLTHTLTREQLSLEGYYHLQLRGTQDDIVKHTNVVSVYVPASISGDANWPALPSAFTQSEQRITELNSHPPIPGENGYWLIWNTTANQYEGSQFPLPNSSGNSSAGIDISGAMVGQTIQIAAVDTNGKPTAWNPVKFPSGSSWELISDIVLEKDGDSATEMLLTKNLAGNSFKYTEVFVSVYGTVMSKVSSLMYPKAKPIGYINGVTRDFPFETYKNGTLKGGDSLNVWMRYGAFTTSFVQEGDGKTNNFHMASGYADKIEGVKLMCDFTDTDGTKVFAYCPLAAGGRITIYGRK